MTGRTGAARYFAEALGALGVTHFFHVPVIVPAAMQEMTKLGTTLPVMTHGEKAAAYMADGYARVSGRPGLCGAQAIGSTNLAAGLRDASLACVPVIAITGGKELHTQYRGAYQEIDDTPAFDALTKFNATVWNPERLPDLLATAFRAATTGTPYPVHLELAERAGRTVMAGELDTTPEVDARFSSFPAIRQASPEADVAVASRAINEAERPVIVAGGGARSSGAGSVLLELARRLSVPVATALNAKGLVPEDDPLAVGTVGEYSSEAANRIVSEADLVFYVGSRTGGLVTRGWTVPPRDTRVVHLDIEPMNLGRNFPSTLGLCGDARTVLQQLLDASPDSGPRDSWLERVAGLKREWEARIAPEEMSDAVPILPQRLCRDLSDGLPSDAVLVTDTGHAAVWLAQNVRATGTGRTFLRSHGSLGWGFPAAIGAKCAAPDRPVICFTGDGGFYYHVAELETALRYGIKVITVVNNNASLSQERPIWGENDALGHLWRMRRTDFATVAEGFGCVGIHVDRPADIRPALAAALDADRPVVIDVRTDDATMAIPAWGP
jgi:acetolactate synthase-1/2/3 large subunit